MSTFVKECRREWKRLGVPDLVAEEMATDLEADLADAEADGVPAAEVLGETDPNHFAAAWANERGLVSEQPERKRTRRFWALLTAGLAALVVVLAVAAGALLATTKAQPFPGIKVNIHTVPVPNFVGLRSCEARTIARHMRLGIETVPKAALRARRCRFVVVAQTPAPGTFVRRNTPPIHLSGPVATLRVRPVRG